MNCRQKFLFVLRYNLLLGKEGIDRKTPKLDNHNHFVFEPIGIAMKTMFTFCFVPNMDLPKVINSYKSVSTCFMKRDFLR
ncbi:hypothetical protein TU50_10600 [Bacillus wiedmannii]|uniref:Uncharacterized protein n=1 Tax=Bacillus wiedmannii TaxID=1890302 RepID=A0AB73R7L5_9BACI|nr:hypothetical protein TU50_10600 [Bacillus wiedmannii]OAK34972.1 hypothetical protein A6284_08550 [Bacillus wiedmannii]OAK38417.1 hypothetical protein A6285_06255 [Bacillus wiedmannii]PEK20874.1 hypothetical protein CN694_23110 [Bacillus wiedmannii]